MEEVSTDKTKILVDALAEYFESDPDEIGDYQITCERLVNGTINFSTAWRGGEWSVIGLAQTFIMRVRAVTEWL